MFKSAFVWAAALFMTAVTVFSPTAASAQAGSSGYACSVKKTRASKGWIPSTLLFLVNGDQVGVLDAMAAAYNGNSPFVATVVEDTDKKLVLRWQVALSQAGQSTIMRYRAVLFRETSRVTVDARPAGDDDKLQDHGTCKVL